MGMTIENSIRILEDFQKWEKQYGMFGNIADDAIIKLLEVAKKYQKIVDIVSLNDEEFKQCGLRELKEILEVIAGYC